MWLLHPTSIWLLGLSHSRKHERGVITQEEIKTEDVRSPREDTSKVVAKQPAIAQAREAVKEASDLDAWQGHAQKKVGSTALYIYIYMIV